MDIEELLLTPAHPRHQERWMLHHPRLPLCLGCSVMILEDPQKLNTYKRLVLNAFLENTQNSNQDFARVVGSNEKVILKTVQTFLALVSQEDLPIAPQAAECVVYVLGQLKRKQLDDLVSQMLMEEILKQCSYERCLLRIRLLGQLSRTCRGIIKTMIRYKQGQFLQFLASGLNFPCDKVKSAIAYIFVGVYKEGFDILILDKSTALHTQITDSILSILKTSDTKDLQTNALVVLQILVQSESILPLFLQNKTKEVFPLVLKKLLLSRETSVQVSTSQAICSVLSHASTSSYADVLMNSNIPEFLFEALATSNEFLIESLLCCIFLFTKAENFFKNCYAIYGIEAILRCTENLLELKNWRVASYGLNVTSTLLDKHPVSFSLIPSDSSFKLVLRVIDKGLMSQQATVAIAGSKLLVSSLRYDHLPHPIPIQALLPLLVKCIQFISKSFYVSSREKQAHSHNMKSLAIINRKKEVHIRCKQVHIGLLLVQALIKIYNESNNNPAAHETSFSVPSRTVDPKTNSSEKKPDQIFVTFTLASIQQTLWPYVKLLTREEFSEELVIELFDTIALLYETNITTELDGLSSFNKNLLSTSFISFLWQCRKVTINSPSFEKIMHASSRLLKYLLNYLLKEDCSATEERMKRIEIGIKYFDAALDTCCLILSQARDTMAECSDILFSTQAAFLQMCYYAYLNGDRIIPTSHLQAHLVCFIHGVMDFTLFPLVCKHAMLLLAITSETSVKSDETLMPRLKEATLLLRNAVLRFENSSLIYTHHRAMLSWSLLFSDAKDRFHQYIIYEWLKNCQLCLPENDEKQDINRYQEIETLFENVFRDEKLQENYIMLLTSYSCETSKITSDLVKKYLKKLQQNEADDTTQEAKSHKIIKFLNEKLPAVLLKMLLEASSGHHKEMKMAVVLELLIWCRNQNVKCFPCTPTEVKLIFQVMRHLAHNGSNEASVLLMWRYLESTFINFGSSSDLKAIFAALTNKNVVILIENHLGNNNNTELFSSALGFLASLIRYQTKHDIKWFHREVSMPVTHLIRSLHQLNIQNQIYALQILKELFSLSFEHAIIFLKSDCLLINAEKESHLSSSDIRLIFFAILNIIVKVNAEIDALAIQCLQSLISYIETRQPLLAAYCMSLPWLRIVLEARFSNKNNQSIDYTNWQIFLLCIKSSSINESLTTCIENVARQITLRKCDDTDSNTIIIMQVINELCTGTYKTILHSEIKLRLQEISEEVKESSGYLKKPAAEIIPNLI